MKFDPETVENQTATMTTLAQLLRIVGGLSVVVGCIGVAGSLVSWIGPWHWATSGSGVQALVGGLSLLITGIIQLAIAASLQALRAIAVNCAKMAAASDGTYINVRARKF